MAGVVGVSGEDGECAIELLGEHDAGELVGKGHGAEGEQEGGALAGCGRPAIGGADGEVEMLDARVALVAEPCGELLGRKGTAPCVEKNQLCGCASRFFECGEKRGLRGEVLLLDGGVVSETFAVFLERIVEEAEFLAGGDGRESHTHGFTFLYRPAGALAFGNLR